MFRLLPFRSSLVALLLSLPVTVLAQDPAPAPAPAPAPSGEPAQAPATPPPSAPAGLTVPAGLVVHKVAGNLLVGATAEGKLITYDISDPSTPQKRSERDAGGVVVDLRLVDGMVFAVVAEQKVQAFSVAEGGRLDPFRAALTAPSGPATVTPKPAAPAASVRAVVGTVKTSKRGHVLIELEDAGTLRPGDRVLVRSQHKEKRLNLFSGREEEVVSNAPVAVITVRQVQGRQAIADLARGDTAEPGDTVEPTNRSSDRSLLQAPRVGYEHWTRATLRPFLNFGDVDVGSITQLEWGMYWEFLHIQARVAPLGISVPYAVDALNAQVMVSYQNDLAELGLGTGYLRHTYEAEYWETCSGDGSSADIAFPGSSQATTARHQCTIGGATVLQHLRLGPVDGLHLRLTNTVTVENGEFTPRAFEGSLDLPITRELNLYGAGGGIYSGVAYGEGGLRTYLRGVGGRDTLILTTGIGGSSVRTSETYGGKIGTIPGRAPGTPNSTQITDEKDSVGGLHISVGLEYRY